MPEVTVVWSVDDQDGLVATIGNDVIHRVEPGTNPKKAKWDYLLALRARDARDRRLGLNNYDGMERRRIA